MYYVLGINDDSLYILDVLKSIYDKWEDLAGVLKLKDHVGRIKYDHKGDSKASMRALLEFWMYGNGVTASYQSLLDTLEEAGLASEEDMFSNNYYSYKFLYPRYECVLQVFIP